MIEKGHLYLARPPLFKITKNGKSTYIKDEKKRFRKYILKNSENGAKKTKKIDIEKFINEEKQKLTYKGLKV